MTELTTPKFKPAQTQATTSEKTPSIFNFEGNGIQVKTIPLEYLRKSVRRDSGLAGIRSVPIQFWHLLLMIQGLFDEKELNYLTEPIYVQYNSSKAYLTDEDKEKGYNKKSAPIEKWRFDKIIASIQLPNVLEESGENPKYVRNQKIGIALNKMGIQVGFGMNVKICKNFNVLGGTILRSYSSNGKDGYHSDAFLIVLKEWLSNLNQIWRVQNTIMQEMLKYELGEGKSVIVKEILGDLYLRAIKNAYHKEDVTAPFNTNELSNITQGILNESYYDNEKDHIMIPSEVKNVWDLYNFGTNILKPGTSDIGEIAEKSNIWGNYLKKYFDLQFEEFSIN